MGKRDRIDKGVEARRAARKFELFNIVAGALTQRVILDKRKKPAKHKKPLRGED